MKITDMKIMDMIKHNLVRLVGLILITIPLLACYPIMVVLGLPTPISVIATACLTVIAYFGMICRVEPVLRRVLSLELVPLMLLVVIFLLRFLPFESPKIKENLEENRHKRITTKKSIS